MSTSTLGFAVADEDRPVLDELVEYFGYYNTERLHSSLAYRTPSDYERRARQAAQTTQ